MLQEEYEALVGRAVAALEARNACRKDARLELRAQRLCRLTKEQRRTFLSNLPPYRSLELAQFLANRAYELRYGAVAEMVAAAEAACEVADAVTDHPLPSIAADVRAESWAVRANVHRIAGELVDAITAFRQAYAHLEEGSGDPLVAARIGTLYATLLKHLGEPERALGLFEGVLRIYRTLGEEVEVGRTLVRLGQTLHVLGRYEEAERCLATCLALPSVAADPALYIAAAHPLAMVCSETGRTYEALALLRKTRPLYAALASETAALRYLWLEARLASEVGELSLAESLFTEVRAAFLAKALDNDAAHASLELALVLFKQGRAAEVAALADETYEAFAARQLDERANAALLLWVNAVRSGSLTSEVLTRLASELKSARRAEG